MHHRNIEALDRMRLTALIVYESALKESEFFHSGVVNDFVQFKQQTDVTVANRMSADVLAL